VEKGLGEVHLSAPLPHTPLPPGGLGPAGAAGGGLGETAPRRQAATAPESPTKRMHVGQQQGGNHHEGPGPVPRTAGAAAGTSSSRGGTAVSSRGNSRGGSRLPSARGGGADADEENVPRGGNAMGVTFGDMGTMPVPSRKGSNGPVLPSQVQFPRITTKVQVPPNTLGLIKSNSFRAPVGGAAAGSPSPTGAGLDSSRSFGTSRPVTPGSPVATTPKHSTKNAFPARSQRS